jgi:putative transposase
MIVVRKYRCYPREEQIPILEKYFGILRWLWNHFLNLNIERYKKEKKFYFYNDMARMLTALKEENIWLKEVPSDILQPLLKRLDLAIQAKIKAKQLGRDTGFPRFKSKYTNPVYSLKFSLRSGGNNLHQYSFSIPESQKGEKVERIRWKKHQPLIGKQKEVILTRDRLNHWYVCVACEIADLPLPKPVKEKDVIGIDVGIKRLTQCSNGAYRKNLRNKLQPYYDRIKELQQELSSLYEERKRFLQKKLKKKRVKVVPTCRMKEAKRRLAKAWLVLTRRRTWLLHQLSNRLLSFCKALAVEGLKVKKMLQSKQKNLNRAIAESCWSTLRSMLQYKAKLRSKIVIEVPPQYSSQTCNKCGMVSIRNRLTQAEFKCVKCGYEANADFNASKVIRHRGILLLKKQHLLVA